MGLYSYLLSGLLIISGKITHKNIGADATGTNFIRSTNKYNVEPETDFKQFDFSNDLKLNKEIIEQINRIVKPGIISYLKYRLFNIY